MDDPERELADDLADATARFAARHAFAIEEHGARGRYALAAAPVAVVFARPLAADAPATHRSGRIAPELLPFLVDATARTRARLSLADDRDNAYLIALVLASFYVVEAQRSGALGLGDVAQREPRIRVVAEDVATRDVLIDAGATALRVLAPVEGDDGTAVNAAIELLWR